MADLTARRELFIRNRDTVQSVFKWDLGMMNLCCAYLYTLRGRTADAASLKQNKSLLKERVSGFSNFHSTGRDGQAAFNDPSGAGCHLRRHEGHNDGVQQSVPLLLIQWKSPSRW